jgi:hypothetical protein
MQLNNDRANLRPEIPNLDSGVVPAPGTSSEKREDAKARRREEKQQGVQPSRFFILFLLRAFVPSRLRVFSLTLLPSPAEALHPSNQG